jgi:hypothetical protein
MMTIFLISVQNNRTSWVDEVNETIEEVLKFIRKNYFGFFRDDSGEGRGSEMMS